MQYLDLLEAARGEFFRRINNTFRQFQDEDVIFPVIECRLRYKSPARYDDVLTIEVWPMMAEKVRLNFAYRILNQNNALVFEAETFHACVSLNEKLKRLPQELRKLLETYLRLQIGQLICEDLVQIFRNLFEPRCRFSGTTDWSLIQFWVTDLRG